MLCTAKHLLVLRRKKSRTKISSRSAALVRQNLRSKFSRAARDEVYDVEKVVEELLLHANDEDNAEEAIEALGELDTENPTNWPADKFQSLMLEAIESEFLKQKEREESEEYELEMAESNSDLAEDKFAVENAAALEEILDAASGHAVSFFSFDRNPTYFLLHDIPDEVKHLAETYILKRLRNHVSIGEFGICYTNYISYTTSAKLSFLLS